MCELTFCLVTPSYKPDFARCRLLAESIEQFTVAPIHHYVVVDRQDFKLFQQLTSSQRTIITVESLLPWWIFKIPLVENGWLSWKTLPIRNWLIQQIVKLEIARYLKEDILIFVDSDVFFIRPFDYQQFVQNGKVRLFRKSVSSSPVSNIDSQLKWSKTATSLLGLPPSAEFDRKNSLIRYVGNSIAWKRENVLLLHRYIEQITQKSSLQAIASQWHFSEYMLYGIFVERVLKENSGHYWDSQKVTHDYWGTTPLKKEQLQQFIRDIPLEVFAVMISAKSKTPVDSYASLVRKNINT